MLLTYVLLLGPSFFTLCTQTHCIQSTVIHTHPSNPQSFTLSHPIHSHSHSPIQSTVIHTHPSNPHAYPASRSTISTRTIHPFTSPSPLNHIHSHHPTEPYPFTSPNPLNHTHSHHLRNISSTTSEYSAVS